MNDAPQPAVAPARRSFAALRRPGFRAQFVTFALAMMADNIEHVISYWVVFQKFQSPALAGFAVVSHWLPFLLFSVAAGALADRFDPRRLIQCGMGLFIMASLGWGYFFITDTLEMWHAMVLLVIHGCAGVLWQTPNQMLLYDIAGPADLSSAVRLNATARYLGVLVGPAMGGAIMLALGPSHGILLNTLFYLPLVLWLVNAPYGPRFRKGAAAPRRAVRGLADIVQTARDIAGQHVIVSMVLLAGCTSFFVGNAYNAQMPSFAQDLGHGDPGMSYSMLLAADAAGAMLAGVVLEGRGLLPANPRTAIILAMLWCSALVGIFAGHCLSVCAGAAVHRRLFRAVVQRHGANAGTAQCARGDARPRPRPVQHGEPRIACLFRRHHWPHGQPDRHPLVAGALGPGHPRLHVGAARPAAPVGWVERSETHRNRAVVM